MPRGDRIIEKLTQASTTLFSTSRLKSSRMPLTFATRARQGYVLRPLQGGAFCDNSGFCNLLESDRRPLSRDESEVLDRQEDVTDLGWRGQQQSSKRIK